MGTVGVKVRVGVKGRVGVRVRLRIYPFRVDAECDKV